MIPHLKAFMQDYMDATKPNPKNEKERIFDGCALQCYIYGNSIWLGHIRTGVRQQGHGEAGLNFIKALADRHGVPVEGDVQAQPDGNNSKNQIALENWYKKNGFDLKHDRGAVRLLYVPMPPTVRPVRESEDPELALIRRLAGL